MLHWFIRENIEVDSIISVFGLSNYGLIAIQFYHLMPYDLYSLSQFERSDLISVLKNSMEYSFVFFKCLSEMSRYLSGILMILTMSMAGF